TVRVPREGWQPSATPKTANRTPQTSNPTPHATSQPSLNVTADRAIKTPQFWLLWIMLCVNVTAGIGVLGQASPMIQEMFPGVITATAAAGFVGLLSLANMIGRFFWSSLSDYIGRRATYATFFLLGAILYSLVPSSGHAGSVVLFVIGYVVIMS